MQNNKIHQTNDINQTDNKLFNSALPLKTQQGDYQQSNKCVNGNNDKQQFNEAQTQNSLRKQTNNISPHQKGVDNQLKELNILKQNNQKLFTKSESKNQTNLVQSSSDATKKQSEIKSNKSISGDQIIGLSSQTTGQTLFNHKSQFYLLDQPLQQNTPVNLSHQRLKKNHRQNYQGINSNTHPNQQQKIPTIQEWFQSLSKDDKILALTMIDQVLVGNIVRMQTKLNKKGPGKFKLQTCLKRIPIKNLSNISNDNSELQYVHELHQDFKYTNMKALVKDDKHRVEMSTKQLHEQEFLQMIRLTHTKVDDGNYQNNRVAQIMKEDIIDDQLNTLTVSQQLVQDPFKFYQLIQSIVGQTFLKIPLEIEWDAQSKYFLVKTPTWFIPSANNSLANWIIFYFEIALWIHYEAYVKSRFRGTKDSLDSKIFISKDNQVFNLRNELQSYWQQFVDKSKSQPDLLKDLGNEIYNRLEKSSLIKPLVYIEEPLSISQLNGGLISVKTTKPLNSFNSNIKIIEALQQNKDSDQFFNELCLVSLNKLGSQLFQMEKVLVDILREKQQIALSLQKAAKNSKNNKKKNKKKNKAMNQNNDTKEQNNNEDETTKQNTKTQQLLNDNQIKHLED